MIRRRFLSGLAATLAAPAIGTRFVYIPPSGYHIPEPVALPDEWVWSPYFTKVPWPLGATKEDVEFAYNYVLDMPPLSVDRSDHA